MSNILTAAGVKFCLSLGVLDPTYDTCRDVVYTMTPPSDWFWNSVSLQTSVPDSYDNNTEFAKYDGCVQWAEYDIFDGTKGHEYYCWREATIHWIPEAGRWKWSYPEKVK